MRQDSQPYKHMLHAEKEQQALDESWTLVRPTNKES